MVPGDQLCDTKSIGHCMNPVGSLEANFSHTPSNFSANPPSASAMPPGPQAQIWKYLQGSSRSESITSSSSGAPAPLPFMSPVRPSKGTLQQSKIVQMRVILIESFTRYRNLNSIWKMAFFGSAEFKRNTCFSAYVAPWPPK